jgi:SlyX protein
LKRPELVEIAGAREWIPGRRCLLQRPELPAHRAGRIMPAMSERLDAIEEKLAFLERAVNELSDVVARQQKELGFVRERNQRLMEKLAAAETDFGPSATAWEKPPHY